MTRYPTVLSVITPAYNEEANLPVLYDRLSQVLNASGLDWEWIVVDDHSADATFNTVTRLAAGDPHVRGLRFARNFGSHTAITCGLDHCRGHCATIMAADLQDPPETLPLLVERWQSGAQIVWAARGRREGEKASTVGFARLYYWLMRRVVGLKEISAEGADFLLLDRTVIDAFLQFREANVSIFALFIWMGFRQDKIVYTKEARLHGQSNWTLRKKIKLVVDSIAAFTYLPIRLMSMAGFVVAVFGFCYAILVLCNSFLGYPQQGWSSLMVVVLILGGTQMIMMGMLGEYLWRALDESRRRPRYLIEALTEAPAGVPAERDS